MGPNVPTRPVKHVKGKVKEVNWVSHECLYLPGKVEGRSLQYLLDTGSSENILSMTLFNQLPRNIKTRLQGSESRATMADGSGLVTYGTVELTCGLLSVKLSIQFKVANITDDAILGIDFFNKNECSIQIAQGILTLKDQSLACTGRNGIPIASKVQVTRSIFIPQGAEIQVICRLTTPPTHPQGVVEHLENSNQAIRIAATLTKPNQKDRIIVRCMNTSSGPVSLRAGSTLGIDTPITNNQILRNDLSFF